MNDGWIGIVRNVTWYLTVVGADRDEKGRFIVSGDIALFLGIEDENNDIVVGPDALYYVNGKPAGLAAGLRSTSYGVKVKVI